MDKHIVQAGDLAELNKDGILILDVRMPDEFHACHIPGALNIPLDKLENGQIDGIPRDKPIYLICQSGVRSNRAYHVLKSLSFDNIYCVDGGVNACSQVKGLLNQVKKHMPIMRQVQIIAGTVILLGYILSILLNPQWIYLSVFIGCALIFAGFTGFCAMAILLEKMPWNRL